MKKSKSYILALGAMALAAPLLANAVSASKEGLNVWIGNSQGQTIDAAHSFVIVGCDASNAVFVNGHLNQTNQSGQTLQVAVKLDGGVPFVVSDVAFVPNIRGNGNFAFSLEGLTPGLHNLVVEVQNNAFPGVNLYFNESANNSLAYPGVPFVCQ